MTLILTTSNNTTATTMKVKATTTTLILLLIAACSTQVDAHAFTNKHSLVASVVKKTQPATKELLRQQQKQECQEDDANPITVRGGDDAPADGLAHRLKIGGYFATWYALNVVYNVINKKLLNTIPAPLTIGSMQFLVGALYSTTLWVTGLRAAPRLTKKGKRAVSQVGFFHCFGQLMSMISLGAGPVSFTHIVKALEPFFSAIVSAVMLGQVMRPQVYATLIPVVCGVGYACMKEKFFSWLAFNTAMLSNVAFALRAVVSKSAMTNSIGDNITSANLFGLVTWMAFFVSIPMFVFGEGTSFLNLWKKAIISHDPIVLARQIVVSGLFHYLNNEVMYLALSNVHPVTLAVGNTMKRVFIMVASVIVFRNPISFQAGLGSAVGIGGVLLYSLTKQYYQNLDAEIAAISAGPTNRRNNRRNNKK